VSSALSGAGNLNKLGPGTLSLTGSNTCTGPIQIQQGVLLLPNGLNQPGAAITIDAGGQLTAADIVNRAVTGGGTLTSIGPLVAGDMTNPAGFNFSGTVNIGGNDVFLFSAGTVQLGVATNLSAGGRLDTINGAQLSRASAFTATGSAEVVGAFANNGAVSGPGGTAWLTFDDALSGSGSFSGNVQLLGGYTLSGGPLDVASGDLILDSVEGSQGLDKTGGGTLTLDEPNSYSGGTDVAAGTLVVANSGALGGGPSLTVGSDAGLFDVAPAGALRVGSPTFAAPVPEPSTFVMLVVGGVALLGYRWRRRRVA
jgi:autotransporter-associated beta strand protein